jgi:hypothetical protein
VRHYGHATWQNALYPTRDHHIPWKLFLLYLRALPRLRAAEQLAIARAVTQGYTAARIPKEKAFAFESKVRHLERFADGEDLGEEGHTRERARDQQRAADDDTAED